jgi:hypothetical protein
VNSSVRVAWLATAMAAKAPEKIPEWSLSLANGCGLLVIEQIFSDYGPREHHISRNKRLRLAAAPVTRPHALNH